MGARAIAANYKKLMVKKVGADLVKTYGKKSYYSKAMVDGALRRQRIPADYSCWAYSFFTSRSVFDEIHQATGEACDYAAMRADMASSVTDGASATAFDTASSWLDWSGFDFSGLGDLGGLGDISFGDFGGDFG